MPGNCQAHHRWEKFGKYPPQGLTGGNGGREKGVDDQAWTKEEKYFHLSWVIKSSLSSGLRGPPELCNLALLQTWSMERHFWCNTFIITAALPLSSLSRETTQVPVTSVIAMLTQLFTWKFRRFWNQRACGHYNQETIFMSPKTMPIWEQSDLPPSPHSVLSWYVLECLVSLYV